MPNPEATCSASEAREGTVYARENLASALLLCCLWYVCILIASARGNLVLLAFLGEQAMFWASSTS